MAINNAAKFEKKLSYVLKAKKKSTGFTNQDWSWEGVDTINAYSLTAPTMGNYNENGSANRYGLPTEVEDTIQTHTVTRDRSWAKVMDKKNIQDTMQVRRPAAYLAQATREVLVPEMDAYIFQTIATAGAVANRDDIVADAATTSVNAYTNLTTINAQLTDDEAPEEGRVAAMTAAYYNMLKQSGFVLESDLAYKDRKSGDLGTVDNLKITIVPSNRMPVTSGAIDLLISHPSVTVAPEKLEDYTLHSNPQGISGYVLEYRHRYDAFVDTNRVECIGMHAVA